MDHMELRERLRVANGAHKHELVYGIGHHAAYLDHVPSRIPTSAELATMRATLMAQLPVDEQLSSTFYGAALPERWYGIGTDAAIGEHERGQRYVDTGLCAHCHDRN